MTNTSTPIRLALREEGNWWVAYVATTDNMAGAIEIGRMHLNALREVPDGVPRWKALMVDILAANLTSVGATVLGWDEQKAPEHERRSR